MQRKMFKDTVSCAQSFPITQAALHANRKSGKLSSKFFSISLIELLVNAACKTGVLYNRCGMLSLWGGAFVRMIT